LEIVYDKNGNPLHIQSVVRDISQRKQNEAVLVASQAELEQRVQERTSELRAANRELETLVHTMAHDLRTPLRAMAGYSHLLEENVLAQLDENSRFYLNRVKAGTRRMDQLINDLMAYMHLRRQSLHKYTVDTPGLVQQVLNELLGSLDKTRKVMVSIAELPPCSADPRLLHIVFTNLLENAFKYTAKRPEAHIEIGAQKGAYFVRDNGVGFEPQYAEKIFTIFERLHRIDEFEGTGIGLAIVKRIVERHGGHIWAESQIDKGATFYFTLE
jgi:light-regulated signal transduction histidine kinase (bacteriophytochrome)